MQRCHKFGLVLEFFVGEGKLLVCMSLLIDIMDEPAANQLYQSMLRYKSSDVFNPQTRIDADNLLALF